MAPYRQLSAANRRNKELWQSLAVVAVDPSNTGKRLQKNFPLFSPSLGRRGKESERASVYTTRGSLS